MKSLEHAKLLALFLPIRPEIELCLFSLSFQEPGAWAIGAGGLGVQPG